MLLPGDGCIGNDGCRFVYLGGGIAGGEYRKLGSEDMADLQAAEGSKNCDTRSVVAAYFLLGSFVGKPCKI